MVVGFGESREARHHFLGKCYVHEVLSRRFVNHRNVPSVYFDRMWRAIASTTSLSLSLGDQHLASQLQVHFDTLIMITLIMIMIIMIMVFGRSIRCDEKIGTISSTNQHSPSAFLLNKTEKT